MWTIRRKTYCRLAERLPTKPNTVHYTFNYMALPPWDQNRILLQGVGNSASAAIQFFWDCSQPIFAASKRSLRKHIITTSCCPLQAISLILIYRASKENMLRCPPLITAFWACLVYVVTILIETYSITSIACWQLCQIQVHRAVFPFGPFAYAWYEPVGPFSLVGIGPVWLSYIHSIINQLDRIQKIFFPSCIVFLSLHVHY